MKTVCYFLTRNLYRNVLPSLKSLLRNGYIDRVYLFIEDDDIGFDLPAKVITVNVSDQLFFLRNGPNYNSPWTYMTLMKAVACWLLPNEHKVLTLDVDTIIQHNLHDLWELDLSRHCVAGSLEPYWTNMYKRDYVNAGVLMWNLDMMRDGRAEKIVRALNEKYYTFNEQDCISEQLQGEILPMDSAYNFNRYVVPPNSEPIRILHFAAYGQEAFRQQPETQIYAGMSWEEVCGDG